MEAEVLEVWLRVGYVFFFPCPFLPACWNEAWWLEVQQLFWTVWWKPRDDDMEQKDGRSLGSWWLCETTLLALLFKRELSVEFIWFSLHSPSLSVNPMSALLGGSFPSLGIMQNQPTNQPTNTPAQVPIIQEKWGRPNLVFCSWSLLICSEIKSRPSPKKVRWLCSQHPLPLCKAWPCRDPNQETCCFAGHWEHERCRSWILRNSPLSVLPAFL